MPVGNNEINNVPGGGGQTASGVSNTSTGSAGGHSHSLSGTASGAIWSGGSSTPMDFAVNYRDVIKVNKA